MYRKQSGDTAASGERATPYLRSSRPERSQAAPRNANRTKGLTRHTRSPSSSGGPHGSDLMPVLARFVPGVGLWEVGACRTLEREAGDSKDNPTEGNPLLPEQVAGAVSQSVAGISEEFGLLTSASCGDISRFGTERLARSRLRTDTAAERSQNLRLPVLRAADRSLPNPNRNLVARHALMRQHGRLGALRLDRLTG